MLVLIVEDDALVGMDLRDELLRAGYQVAGPAADETEALALASDQAPDVAVVDIDLHGGHEGLELARTLRCQYGVATVFVSGEAAAARANMDAAFGYLPKPYTPGDVVRAIEIVASMGRGDLAPPPPIPRSMELFA